MVWCVWIDRDAGVAVPGDVAVAVQAAGLALLQRNVAGRSIGWFYLAALTPSLCLRLAGNRLTLCVCRRLVMIDGLD